MFLSLYDYFRRLLYPIQKNILVDEEGHARLVDFGRARVIGEAIYRTAFMAGSAPYMPPELLPENDVDVDELFSKQSDVYGFAMSCFTVSHAAQPTSLCLSLPRYSRVKDLSKVIMFLKTTKSYLVFIEGRDRNTPVYDPSFRVICGRSWKLAGPKFQWIDFRQSS
jgi:serine/threonine protein kinase